MAKHLLWKVEYIERKTATMVLEEPADLHGAAYAFERGMYEDLVSEQSDGTKLIQIEPEEE